MPSTALQAEVQFGVQGRMVVPAALRKALGFCAGDALLARVVDGSLIIEKADSVERRVRARFQSVSGKSLADELIAERRAEAQRESDR
ncbi:MAG: AbrB/MazE/SpoVT family DNA-binding domain-containing protein [Chromatiales bacterium]|jgi:AbrB family looped-hinge helix DNA binding protein|nr:AbrB/MazE/SpoVT family DNA-binding domain-containing protein [Chromatiales bacterium]